MRACWMRDMNFLRLSTSHLKYVKANFHLGKDFIFKSKTQYSSILALNRDSGQHSFSGNVNGEQHLPLSLQII